MARSLIALSFVLALASAAIGADFQVTVIPDVTDVETPKPLDRAALKQAQGVGMADLQKYAVTAGFDKGGATPKEKAEGWRKLAGEAPSLAAMAGKRAGEWETYAKKVGEALEKRKTAAMDSDWKRLRLFLQDGATSGPDRTAGTMRFLDAYVKVPGVTFTAAMDMYAFLPAGPLKDALAEYDRIGRYGITMLMERTVYGRIKAGGGIGIGIDALRKKYESTGKAWQESDKGRAVRRGIKALDERDWGFGIVEDDRGKTMSVIRLKVSDPVYVSGKRFPDFTSLESALDGEVADELVNWILFDRDSPMSAPYKAALEAIRGEEVSGR